MDNIKTIIVTEYTTGQKIHLTKDMIITFYPNAFEGTTVKLKSTEALLYIRETHADFSIKAKEAFKESMDL